MKARLPAGMGKNPQNMNSMIRQAQKMQEEMETLQAELELREYEVSAGGGVVKIKIDGKKEIKSIDIAPEIVDPDDIVTLADVLTAGINEAIKKVDEANSEAMSKITGGLNIPGMPGGF